jgi:integrase
MVHRKLPFNNKAVRAAAHAGIGTETEFRFDNLKGLVLHVLAGGKRSWRVHYSLTCNGKRVKRKVSIGAYPHTKLAEAGAKAANMLERVAKEGDVVALDKVQVEDGKRQALTFSDLFEEYLIERAEVVRIKEVERELRKDVLPTLGQRHPAKITPGDLDTIGRAIKARDAPAMAHRMIEHMKALYNFVLLDRPSMAEKYGITINPAATLGRKRRGSKDSSGYAKPKPRERVLDDDQIVQWWRALDASDIRSGSRLALQLVLVTAQRPGEVRRAQAADLTLTGKDPHWIIPAAHSKNGRAHWVPLSPLAVRLFKQAPKISASKTWLFPDPEDTAKPINQVVLPTTQSNLFRRALPDLPSATVHDLRRTAATGMRALRVPREDVGMVLNHTPQDVTSRHYDHHAGADEKRVALSRWAKHLERLTA